VREVIGEQVKELAEEHPCYGYRKIWALTQKTGLQGSRSTVYRVLKEAGLLLEPRYQQELRENSRARKQYLHRPTEPNQLWQVDLTQVPISDYGVYWVTSVVDYYSRYVLTCHFSPTHTAQDVIEALEKALEEARQFYVIEESEVITLVSDNGPQFTSRRFREYLQSAPFRHVRARSHHPETLGMVERFHQSLKYEEIWPNDYEDPLEAQMRIAIYREHYNQRRPHQALDYGVPAERYCEQALREVETPETRYTFIPESVSLS